VLDNDHAFSCDGMIVHNSSADITKIAMGLIYKEMRDQGWLDKCQMIITMHDELVFEIDLDIIDEAIKVIVPLMNRNSLLMSRNWPIPLTSDVEMGYSWAVPWDLNAMVYKEVRFIGNTKYTDPKEKGAKPLPEGYVWEEMPSWPEVLRPFFKAVTEPPASFKDQPQQESPVVETIPEAPEPDRPVNEQTPIPVPLEHESVPATPVLEPRPPEPIPQDAYVIPDVPSGDVFEFRLHTDLTLGVMFRLASVIYRCKNKGTRVLRILTREGKPMDEITNQYGKIIVNPMTFVTLAQDEQL
jgi:hypothetical protein